MQSYLRFFLVIKAVVVDDFDINNITGGTSSGISKASRIKPPSFLILGSKVAGVQFPNNTIDLGLIAGLSYKLNEKFALDARYNFGLLEVSDGVPAKNRFVTAGVSYLLK
ncbi:hypothetical protein RAO04_03590 [Ornithobacterium rhinotracheale]|uniref:hypothetical protein n=1 Tax=Ornithobacterium rhinotracheale TaxID=28251 RepID=UPI003873C5D7